MPHAAQSSRPLWSTLLIALLLLLYSSAAAATLNNVRQGGGSSTSIFSSSPASSHGSPDYTYLSTPSPEPQPAPPRFRLPYPRPDLYNVRTNLRHDVWKSSPERLVASTALTSAGQEGSRSTSSPPRKRPRLSANAPSPVWPKFAAPATLSQSRRSSPHSSPLSALTSRLHSPAPSASHRSSSSRQQNSPPRLLAPADSKRKSKVMHLFSKGIGKIKGCFGARKGRCE